jgi:kinesin family member 5
MHYSMSSSLPAQNDNLQVHEEKSKGVYVKNLSDYYVSSAREVYEIMRTGGAARVISSTSECLYIIHS